MSAVLQEACPDWEVINASVSGYSTDQEYLFYREEGSRYRPDRVLLLIHENDLAGNAAQRMYGYEKPRFVARGDELELHNVPVRERRLWERAYGWLTTNSYLAHGLLRRPRIALMLEFGQPWGTTELPMDAIVNRRLFTRFAGELRREGTGFHWALVPMSEPATSLLRSLGARLGVPVLDLQASFEGARRAGLALTLEGDRHWNAAGHRVAGETIAEHLGCGLRAPTHERRAHVSTDVR